MAEPVTIRIPYEDFEYGRFTHVGRFGDGNQFLAYITYASKYVPKSYYTEEDTADGQVAYRQHTNCFAVVHRFDADGRHLSTEVERVEGTQESDDRDWSKLAEMISQLGEIVYCDIRVKPFRMQIGNVVHGLIYECVSAEDPDDPNAVNEYVMLEPNDIMFHPPWDSGDYST